MANFKSVLEKYDAKGNRRMPTAEEDAIQPDTTLEELLIGPGKLAAGAITKGISKLANKAEVFMRPKVKNSIYPDRYFGNPDGIRSGQYAVRNVRSPEEIKSIIESGYMLPKKGEKQKYFVQTDDMPTGNAVGKNSVIRVPIGKVPSDRAVRRRDVEMYNQDSGKFEALKKGGQEAGGRATLRSTGRAGLLGLAGEVGYGLGREIDERTGVGKKMVEGSDKMGSSNRVKLSEDSRNRIADMQNDEAMREVDAEKETKKYAKGGYVKSADGIAQRGKTKGRMC